MFLRFLNWSVFIFLLLLRDPPSGMTRTGVLVSIGGYLCSKCISSFLPHLSFNWRTAHFTATSYSTLVIVSEQKFKYGHIRTREITDIRLLHEHYGKQQQQQQQEPGLKFLDVNSFKTFGAKFSYRKILVVTSDKKPVALTIYAIVS